MRRWCATAAWLAALLPLAACSSTASSAPTTITVAAAASLSDVFPAIAEDFTAANPDVRVRFTFAGSNALVEQVRAGAPIDVLATASLASMASTGDLVGQSTLFARNALTIVMPPGNPGQVQSLADLPRVSVALCAAAVPCGVAADELLQRNDISVTPVTRELDVRAVLGKVLADQVDAGIVYITDARAAGDRVQTITIPGERNVETSYPAAVVASSPHEEVGAAFIDYLTSPQARAVLTAAGFDAP